MPPRGTTQGHPRAPGRPGGVGVQKRRSPDGGKRAWGARDSEAAILVNSNDVKSEPGSREPERTGIKSEGAGRIARLPKLVKSRPEQRTFAVGRKEW